VREQQEAEALAGPRRAIETHLYSTGLLSSVPEDEAADQVYWPCEDSGVVRCAWNGSSGDQRQPQQQNNRGG
jgi:hypothetical protein